MGLKEYPGGQYLLEEGEKIIGTNGTLEGKRLIRVSTIENPPALTIQGGGIEIYVEGTSDIYKAVQNLKP